jgi:Secretion system C-terminal sorting domain
MRNSSWILLVSVTTMLSLPFGVRADVRMTAGNLKTTADLLALTFASDAKLALVASVDVDTAGKSSIWRYVYFSLDSLEEYQFLAENHHVIFDTSQGMRIGVGILDVQWVDSDSALSVAEWARGVDIRRRFPGCTIAASLLRPVAPPFSCCWRIDYRCSDSTRTVVIDAATGQLVTYVRQPDNPDSPIRASLRQNYPNPFNPSTTIKYELPRASMVSLSVYDILGREVSVLVNESKNAGVYEVKFDASGLSSGVYFYRLQASTLSGQVPIESGQAGDFVQTKKLMVLR